MPCHYLIFPQENLVAKSYTGRITARCVLSLLDRMEEDPNYAEGMQEYDDLSEVADLAITATEMGHFADLLSGLSARRRRPTRKAAYAPHGPGRIAARGFEDLVRGNPNYQMRSFDFFEDAMLFLDIEPDGFCGRMLRNAASMSG